MAALTLPVFWSSRKLTSLRGPGASALPPLTIFHSLYALQRLDCTQMGHPRQTRQSRCIPAQHRRTGMTRSPRLLRPSLVNKYSSLEVQFFFVCLAIITVGRGRGRGRGAQLLQKCTAESRHTYCERNGDKSDANWSNPCTTPIDCRTPCQKQRGLLIVPDAVSC
jgi:hypothetical protein